MLKTLRIVIVLLLLSGCTPQQEIQIISENPTFGWAEPLEGSPVEVYIVEIWSNNFALPAMETKENRITINLEEVLVTGTFKLRVAGKDHKGRIGGFSKFSKEYKRLMQTAK